ncbi:MAG: histidine kinase [Elusimicrobia bacterium]|nr:histidine kinase [Elusimicrobiota bacterium]
MNTNATSLATEFAPAERMDPEDILQQSESLSRLPLLRTLLDAMPVMVAILNSTRQIVFFNKVLSESVDDEVGTPLGLRSGELLDCAHACEAPNGCGTTRFCRVCGVLKASLEGLAGRPAVEEGRIGAKDPAQSLELRVWATPFRHEGRDYVITALQDISGEKRRAALERIFFHDVLNTANVVLGATELLAEVKAEDAETFRRKALSAAKRLIVEIQSQREIIEAEKGELALKPAELSAKRFLADLVDFWAQQGLALERSLRLSEDCEDAALTTDPALLSRVLTNMIKNGLEAVPAGGAVTVSCVRDVDAVLFRVQNPGVMPESVQLKVFQRSFSTKGGSGRGLGTYGMRLLTESYLKGKVWFESSDESGTVFYARIPVSADV